MTKISVALAAVLVLASASSNVAFAAMPKAHQTQAQDDRTLALAPAPYRDTYRYSPNYALGGGAAARSDYGDPWAAVGPLSDGRPNGS